MAGRRNSLTAFFSEAVSPWRYYSVRKDIESRIPLKAEGKRIVADFDTADDLIRDTLRAHPSLIDRVKQVFGADVIYPPRMVRALKQKLKDDFKDAAEPLSFNVRELSRRNTRAHQRIIMTAPDQLGTDGGLSNRMATMEKWLSARHALLQAGAKIEIIKSSDVRGGYREVYTRDRYVMIGNIAYLPDGERLQKMADDGDHDIDQYEIDNYKGEIQQVKEELEKIGVKTVVVKDAWFEGGNVNRNFRTRTLFPGIYPPWASAASARKLLAAVNATQPQEWSMIKVPLTNYSKMYHVDTGMSEELPDGEVMISSLLTDERTYKKIRKRIGEEYIIELSDKEANAMATNFEAVGDTLVMTANLPELKEKLEKRGYKVSLPSDYGLGSREFGLGGVHCMTNDVPPPPL